MSASISRQLNSAKNIYSYKTLPLGYLQLILIIQALISTSFIPLWLASFTLFVCLYRYFSYRKTPKPVTRFVKYLLFVSSFLVFFSHFRINFTIEMAASFLFLVTVLKAVEISGYKDMIVTIYTMFLVVTVSFLFEQGMLHTLIQLISYGIGLAALMRLNSGSDFRFLKRVRKQIGRSLLISVLSSIPLLIVCFMFFPRLPPLWTMPLDTSSAQIGFGDKVAPGDISKLTKSSEVAFRVNFYNEPPSKQLLYWRALVLDVFDGRGWEKSYVGEIKNRPLQRLDSSSESYAEYEVFLEPHNKKWVFALDGSVPISDNIVMKDMSQYRLRQPAIQATKYIMANLNGGLLDNVAALYTPLSLNLDRENQSRRQDLQLPRRYSNPKTREYIAALRRSGMSDEVLLSQLLKTFREQQFYYTIEPPALGEHSVDEFLFSTKQGFCEHYASSLAFMLRLAKIPARVVVGYQGGELSGNERYMIVRQYDAHAWVEAYLQGVGWVRVDPTAMVAPERILDGGENSFRDQPGFLEGSPMASLVGNVPALRAIALYLDDIKYSWQALVVNYHQDEQESLVEALLGEGDLLNVVLLFSYLLLFLMFFAGGYLWFQKHGRGRYWVEIQYIATVYILGGLGYKRLAGETPRSYLERVSKKAPKSLVTMLSSITYRLELKLYQQN